VLFDREFELPVLVVVLFDREFELPALVVVPFVLVVPAVALAAAALVVAGWPPPRPKSAPSSLSMAAIRAASPPSRSMFPFPVVVPVDWTVAVTEAAAWAGGVAGAGAWAASGTVGVAEALALPVVPTAATDPAAPLTVEALCAVGSEDATPLAAAPWDMTVFLGVDMGRRVVVVRLPVLVFPVPLPLPPLVVVELVREVVRVELPCEVVELVREVVRVELLSEVAVLPVLPVLVLF
jgi:hypothetical protein